MGEHAPVEDDKLAAGNSEKREPMKMPERGDVKGVFCPRRRPCQNPTIGSRKGQVGSTPKEMPVPNQNRNAPAPCDLDFQSIQAHPRPKSCRPFALETFHPSFQLAVEKTVQVRPAVSEPQVGVIARNTIKVARRDFGQREKEVQSKQPSALVNLLKALQLQLVSLLEIDRLAVNDISEEKNVDAVNFSGAGKRDRLFGDGG